MSTEQVGLGCFGIATVDDVSGEKTDLSTDLNGVRAVGFSGSVVLVIESSSQVDDRFVDIGSIH